MRLSLVIPTLNEAENLPRLLPRVVRALSSVDHEIVIVDDGSKDGTPEVVRGLQRRYSELKLIERRSAPGLSASILAGFDAASGDLLAVMDADLQHDPRVLPRLVEAAKRTEIVVGSRYTFHGKVCKWRFLRHAQSRAASWLTRLVLGLRVEDPLSGFFLVHRHVFEQAAPRIEARGWKLLLEILALSPTASVAEVPFTFRARLHGRTKMRWAVVGAWISDLFRLWRLRSRPSAWAVDAAT
jgi:dolichol-phosphate mannosyltransferase